MNYMNSVLRKLRNPVSWVSLLVLLFVSIRVFPGDAVFADQGTASKSQHISSDEFLDSEAGRLFRMGDYESALSALEGLSKKYPKDPLIKRYKAITLDYLGRSDEAVALFNELIDDDPTHVPPRYFLAQAYQRMGKEAESRRELEWIAEQPGSGMYKVWALMILDQEEKPAADEAQREMLRWYVTGRYGYEYDSNVILKPRDDTLTTSRDRNAGRQTFDVDVRYRAYSSRDAAVDMLYAVRQTVHDDSLEAFNYHSQEFGLNARKRVQVGNQDGVAGLRYQFLLGFLENDLFSTRNRWRASFDTRFTRNTRTVFFDRLTIADYGPDGFSPAETSRDGLYNDIGFTHYYYWDNYQRFIYLREEFKSAHTRGRNFDMIGASTRVGVHSPVTSRLSVDASVGLDLRFYNSFRSLSALDNSRRRDRNWDVYLAATYQLTPSLGVKAFYRWFEANNQNNFFAYDRQIGGVQFTYTINR